MDNIISEINSCLGVHPAIRLPFDDLYAGVMNEVALGNVSRQVKGDLELFKYTRQCSFDKNWNIFTLISRGLILCPSQEKVISVGILKFFNFGEIIYLPENEKFKATTKMDGSYISLFCHNNKWFCATLGSFESEQAIWAEKWLNENANTEMLVPGRTYIFECIYRENRIVISYDFEGLVLITGYDEYGNEFLYDDTVEYADKLGTRVVEAPRFSTIDEMIKKADTLSSSEEGWVVRFDNGFRIKIKGATYCRIHRIVSNCTPLAVWDMLRTNSDLEVLIEQLPEEFRIDLKSIRRMILTKENLYIQEIEKLYKDTISLSDKELGLQMQELCKEFPIAAHFIFSCRKMNFLVEYKNPGKIRNALYSKFRPTADVLEGYIPSSAMNRFSDEEEN